MMTTCFIESLGFRTGSSVSTSGRCGRYYSSWSPPRVGLCLRVVRLQGREMARACADRSGKEQESSAGELFSERSFASLGFESSMIDALDSMGISRPTVIQSKSIPAILGRASCVIGAATGSGKTLAYLAPVIQMLKMEEQLNADLVRVSRRPRALVLVPTRELGEQVLGVAKTLAHFVKFRVVGLLGGSASLKKQKDALGSPVDIVIATTGRTLQHLDARFLDLLDLDHVIVDEVDTMLDEGFGPELRRILERVQNRKKTVEAISTRKPLQFIVAGATHPPQAQALYQEVFPGAKRINADLHLPPSGLIQRFVETSSNDKVPELVALLGNSKLDGSLRGGRIVVFCNTISSCRFVAHFLDEAGYTTSCIHGEVPAERRDTSYRQFREGATQLLVCTDIAARGLDNLSIDHVILFDFPSSAVEYLHRVGRTARAGATGRATSLITKKDKILAKSIQEATKERVDTLERSLLRKHEEMERKKKMEVSSAEKEAEVKPAATESQKRSTPTGRSTLPSVRSKATSSASPAANSKFSRDVSKKLGDRGANRRRGGTPGGKAKRSRPSAR